MNANTIFLIVIVLVAIMDVLYATFLLPSLLAKNPNVKPQSIKLIQKCCYGSAAVITVIGLIIYNLHILK